MNRYLILLSVFSLIIINSLKGQSIEGKVIDSRTKDALPFVNIVYGTSNFGTTTNIDGEFNISSKEPVKHLIVS